MWKFWKRSPEGDPQTDLAKLRELVREQESRLKQIEMDFENLFAFVQRALGRRDKTKGLDAPAAAAPMTRESLGRRAFGA